MTTPKELATQEYVLRAMAANYADGNRWDKLDLETCLKAADEIAALRAVPPAEPVADDVEKERCAAVNMDHLERDAFLRAWHAFRHTKIDLTDDSDDEMCKCMRNAIVAYVGAVRLRNKHLPMERDSNLSRRDISELRSYLDLAETVLNSEEPVS